MQEFMTKIIKLKNQNEYNKIQKIIRKENVSQDNQLQDFITIIINLTTDSDCNKIEKIARTKNVRQDNQQ